MRFPDWQKFQEGWTVLTRRSTDAYIETSSSYVWKIIHMNTYFLAYLTTYIPTIHPLIAGLNLRADKHGMSDYAVWQSQHMFLRTCKQPSKQNQFHKQNLIKAKTKWRIIKINIYLYLGIPRTTKRTPNSCFTSAKNVNISPAAIFVWPRTI